MFLYKCLLDLNELNDCCVRCEFVLRLL